jgi:hypothetical protein
MDMVNFNVSNEDAAVIVEIASRAVQQMRKTLSATNGRVESEMLRPLDWAMDVTAVHANGCPLRLRELLLADDFNFAHDVFGIRRHLNRDTGRLTGFFVPRFATAQR